MASGDPSVPTMSGVQGELDALAVALGRSVSLDDVGGTLIGYSIQGRNVDSARVEAILSRRVPAAVLDYQRRFGVDEATGPVRVPANPKLQMGARTCLPVRQQRDVLALLWVLDDDEPLDSAATRTARACAERLRSLLGPPEPVDAEQLLARLFGDQEPPDLTDLVRHAQLADDRVLQFVVVGVRSTQGRAPEATPPLSTSNTVVANVEARGRRLVLTALPRAAPSVVAHEFVADHPSQVLGVSGTFEAVTADPGKVAALAAQAIVAADCAAIDPALPASVAWGDLGLYRRILLTTRLDDWPGPQPVPDDGRSAAMLRHTLEVYLDRAGDAARSITALHIHRTTFYYRLERLNRLYGIDLDDGFTRTTCHLALKTRRLAVARDTYSWTAPLLTRLS